MSTPGPEIWFYQLERTGVAAVVATLAEKSRQRGWRVLVRAVETPRIDELDDILWTYRDDSFLAHGRADAPAAERQPVLLTTDEVNVNHAQVIFLLDGAELPDDLSGIERCVLMFDSSNSQAVSLARRRWKSYKDDGRQVTAWKEAEGGRWVKQG